MVAQDIGCIQAYGPEHLDGVYGGHAFALIIKFKVLRIVDDTSNVKTKIHVCSSLRN